MKLIIIAGGIGSGKSVVSRILLNMGFPVYDCDSRAKQLMVGDNDVKRQLVGLLGNEAFNRQGALNKAYVSERIFADNDLLNGMNAIVHPAVKNDIKRWALQNGESKLGFVETALLHESGLAKLAQSVWHVTAPEQVRVQRVIKRNHTAEHLVRARIQAQVNSAVLMEGEHEIVNDDTHAVVPQIIKLIKQELLTNN